jgi:hypothetical protein
MGHPSLPDDECAPPPMKKLRSALRQASQDMDSMSDRERLDFSLFMLRREPARMVTKLILSLL